VATGIRASPDPDRRNHACASPWLGPMQAGQPRLGMVLILGLLSVTHPVAVADVYRASGELRPIRISLT
jgi:hypothetical protein